jgi:hypothetical protein
MKLPFTKYLIGGTLLLSTLVDTAYAVPSFARQTGFDCTVCHTVFPELTQTGREFKLRGYTMSNGEKSAMPLPLAAMVMVDMTHTSDKAQVSKNNEIVIPQASVFYGGKITDNSGAFIQLTYDGTGLPQNKDIAHHIGMDIMDIRYADSTTLADKELVYGVTLNNNPTVSDLWNSTPAWGFPYMTSTVANAPSASMEIENLGASVGGIGAYALWNDLIYAEISAYRTAKPNGLMNIFGWKNSGLSGDASLVDGTTPYVRLALQHNVGDSYFMVGGYMLRTSINPAVQSNAGGPLDKYTDRAIDAEYQYTSGSNIVTATATKIWEKQKLDGSVNLITPLADNLNNSLATSRAKVSYYFDQTYGASVGYFAINGTADATKYGTAGTLTPNSNGEVAELDYLPTQKIKLALQYTRYGKFDGTSQNASDNNNLYLLGWFMF